MSEITDIKPQIKDKERCSIYIDNRFVCGLKLETVIKSKLKVGNFIELEKLEEIQLENEKQQALDKALTYISSYIKTKKQVKDYLCKKGYLENIADYVLEKLESYNFVDDNSYSKQYVKFKSKGKGKRLLYFELKRKGIQDENINDALSEIEDELSSATDVARKYTRNKELTRENIQKTYRYLISKGFNFDTAKQAVENINEENLSIENINEENLSIENINEENLSIENINE